MSLVLDASVTIAWLYSERTTPAIDLIFNRIEVASAWVPNLWKLEVANVLLMGIRRKRHDQGFRDAALVDLGDLPIQVDRDTDAFAWNITARLADRHNLSLYDAAYLELAMRREIPLASLDGDLRKAGKSVGLELLGT